MIEIAEMVDKCQNDSSWIWLGLRISKIGNSCLIDLKYIEIYVSTLNVWMHNLT